MVKARDQPQSADARSRKSRRLEGSTAATDARRNDDDSNHRPQQQQQQQQQDLRAAALMPQAAERPVRRKSVHQAVSGGNRHSSPCSVIAAGGKGLPQYQNKVLVFLEPHAWDPFAPTVAGTNGYMRAHPRQIGPCCRRTLICFAKQQDAQHPRYVYLGNYQIVTTAHNPEPEIVQDESLEPIDPGSPSGKHILKTLRLGGRKPSREEALAFLENPKHWRVTPLQFVEFDCYLYKAILRQEEI